MCQASWLPHWIWEKIVTTFCVKQQNFYSFMHQLATKSSNKYLHSRKSKILLSYIAVSRFQDLIEKNSDNSTIYTIKKILLKKTSKHNNHCCNETITAVFSDATNINGIHVSRQILDFAHIYCRCYTFLILVVLSTDF